MKSTKFLLLLFSFIVSCKQQNELKNYELIPDDLNILVEKFDSTNVDVNRFNHNNKVYKPGTIFTYKYEHQDTNGDIKYFKVNQDFKSWTFVNSSSADSETIKSVAIEVMNGNPMSEYLPDYNQTVLAYILADSMPFSMSGAIENEANVWIHPPRDHYFEILELNPFPYIKAPYKIGNKWTWSLQIGSKFADERWKTWEGIIENKYEYKITEKLSLETSLGNLECYVIVSQATSSLGKTELVSYFNTKYGFVKLDYTNIDGSKTTLELTDYKINENES